MSTTNDATTTTPLVHVDATTLVLGTPVPKPQSTTGQHEAAVTTWEAADGRTDAGVWECEPGHFTAVREGFGEICQILSGRATVTGADGTSADIGPGSTLVLPDGWSGTWTVHETVRKLYVMIR